MQAVDTVQEPGSTGGGKISLRFDGLSKKAVEGMATQTIDTATVNDPVPAAPPTQEEVTARVNLAIEKLKEELRLATEQCPGVIWAVHATNSISPPRKRNNFNL